ncbi:EamA-like transporter family protein [filamentous cyanobacterium CCP1]|nr:EamA-like transporter family protein [filamentous cyanobacterium CCP2]PSB59662.1 EamA-like transporter family protein [filamentous cyanobacterium CCP1]
MAIAASVGGQFFLKSGALKLAKAGAESVMTHVLSIITIPDLIVGLICYAIGAIAYILVLRSVSLSIVGPSIAASYVFSVLLGHFVFHEAIPVERVVGLGFIVCGVVLVVWNRS